MLSFSTKSHEKKSELNSQNQNKRIGIYGGTFDPIHIAHLIAAESAYSAFRLDEVWFMPTQIPPHKQERHISSSQHRLKMIQLAIEPYPEFKVNTYELEQQQVSYTYNTMSYLTSHYSNVQFYFIVGGDMVEYLPKWYRYEELLQMIPFIAVRRPNYPVVISSHLEKKIEFVEMPQLDISSTDIRDRCTTGKSIRFLVPDSVREYIKEQRLYVG